MIEHSLPLRAAYLGPEGTFSCFAGQDYMTELAARGFSPGEVLFVPCPSIPMIFQAVQEGGCAFGFAPLENSLGGSIGQSLDLFLRHELVIAAEFYARISLCLLSREPELTAVRTVYSHSQPLVQAGNWLRLHLSGARQTAVESTAEAARCAAVEAGSAAVGHRRLAGLNGLGILADALEDNPDNWTRFAVIVKDLPTAAFALPAGADAAFRSSLVFTVPDRPGSLATILFCLAKGAVNMRKLESRPHRPHGKSAWGEEIWQYAFFVDVERDMREPSLEPVMRDMRDKCETLRLLGAYPRGLYLGLSGVPAGRRDRV
jgi:chorismate mutase/prephenate dehydratase